MNRAGGEGLLPSVQARERSCASWGVRLRDSEGLRHLNLLGTPKNVFALILRFNQTFFFSEGSFEDLCLLLFLIK